MPWDGDGFSQGETHHILLSEWRWKIPFARWRRISALQRIIGKNEMPPGIALACQPSSARRLPTIERDRDTDFVRRMPLTHGGSGQEVAQSAVEPHRGSDHDTSILRGTRKPLEDGQNGRLFRSYIQIMNRHAERCINDRPPRVDERPRTIDGSHCGVHCK